MASGGGFRCPKSKIVAGKRGTLLLVVVPGRELWYLEGGASVPDLCAFSAPFK